MRPILLSLFALFAASASAEELRVLNWSEYIVPGLVEEFEASTGVDVVYDHYDSAEVVERRLLAGGSGYDLVVVSSEYLQRLIASGALRDFGVDALSARPDLSDELMERLARFDPGNRHAAPYLWGTTGLGYDRDAILERDPDAPLDSWSLVFDPDIVSQFQDCGVSFVDSPEEVLGAALMYLGHDPNTSDRAKLDEAAEVLEAVSPFVRRFDSEQVWDIAEGRICLAVGWSTDILNAADRAGDARRIEYVLPAEGAIVWHDTFVVPSDAANPDAALAFIDFALQPEHIAAATNHLWAPNSSTAARPLIDAEVLESPFVYPPAERMAALRPVLGRPLAEKRRFEEAWTFIKLGF